MVLKIVLGWFIFITVVYILMLFDILFYKYDLPKVYRKILDAFTEED